jgi:2-oxoglutarate/2-oxoacid ferredoxin oxidoreductase subunit beta
MPRTNVIGLERTDYKGNPSTLCPGCGHDAITNQIISMAFELGIAPHRVIKLSGIGCSGKTPAYFLGSSHGFNGIHGRMPSIATGAMLANRNLIALGISGDGDTGSIGLGQFKHLVRRNVPMVYVIENNGVYGLTKGQFSATADLDQTLKSYGRNELPPLDLALEAIVGGCTFVARSFSGDPQQLQALLRAAISHRGTAVLDVISPCVTFNNLPASTKSYPYGKEHEIPLHEIDYVAVQEPIIVAYGEGEVRTVELHDGSHIRLKKLDRDYDPCDRMQALSRLEDARCEQLLLTGLLYFEEGRSTLAEALRLTSTALVDLQDEQLRPPSQALKEVIGTFR